MASPSLESLSVGPVWWDNGSFMGLFGKSSGWRVGMQPQMGPHP